MTNPISNFMNSMFPVFADENLDDRTKKLFEDARKSIALAEKERSYADIAFAETAPDSETPNLKLAEIAKWHYAQCIKFYSEAIEHLEQTGKTELTAK
jgi:hypothetical protein